MILIMINKIKSMILITVIKIKKILSNKIISMIHFLTTQNNNKTVKKKIKVLINTLQI